MISTPRLWSLYFLSLLGITLYLISYSRAELSPSVGVLDIIEIRRARGRVLTRAERVEGVREYRIRLRQIERYAVGLVSFCAVSYLDRMGDLIEAAEMVSYELEGEMGELEGEMGELEGEMGELEGEMGEERSIEKYIEFFILLKLIYDEFDRVHGCRSDEGYEYREYGL